MKELKNIQIDGVHGRPILLDVSYTEDGNEKPLVIFTHGFKGFKDWGHFNKLAKVFADAGFIYAKFNFSQGKLTTLQSQHAVEKHYKT